MVPRDTPRFLLTGPPRAGKTTLVTHLAERLRAGGVPVGGFVTREIREGGERTGFAIEEIGGTGAVMAHVGWDAGPREGRYRVDVAAIERIAVPALTRAAAGGGVVIIDELGRMELYCEPFVRAAQRLFEQNVPLVATVQAKSHPLTDALKQRPGVELLTVTREGQERLLARITARLLPSQAQAHRPAGA